MVSTGHRKHGKHGKNMIYKRKCTIQYTIIYTQKAFVGDIHISIEILCLCSQKKLDPCRALFGEQWSKHT